MRDSNRVMLSTIELDIRAGKKEGNYMATVAFDVDGCLVDSDKKPINENVAFIKFIAHSQRFKIFVWSGNGYEYAYEVVKKLKLENHIEGVLNKYGTFKPDVAFDDKEINLGKMNIQV